MLRHLLTINGWLLAWRVLMRAGFTASAYGWREGLLSIPRLVVGNVIAMLAAARAVSLHLGGGAEAVGQDPPHLPGRTAAMRPSLRFLAWWRSAGRAPRRRPWALSRRLAVAIDRSEAKRAANRPDQFPQIEPIEPAAPGAYAVTTSDPAAQASAAAG